jgi:large subunit ribosomal protein L25
VVFVDEDECVGITRGGVLNVVRHEVELVADAAEIPSEVTVSLKGFDVGESIHISSVTLPTGVTASIDRDFTIATIVAPSALKSEAVEQAAEEAALAEAAHEESVAEAEAAETEAAAEEAPAAEGDAE